MQALKLFLAVLFLPLIALAEFDHSHKMWTDILAKYHKDGRIRYGTLKGDFKQGSPLFQYINRVAAVNETEFATWTPDQQKAFLINAYNAFTIINILNHYPIASVKKIGGFFKSAESIKFFSILDGKTKSLNDIEKNWLRKRFQDYRVIAAIHKGALSWPKLRKDAFVHDKLEIQLDEQMRGWVADRNLNRINPFSRSVTISKIFEWYEKDFKTAGGWLAVLNKYMSQPYDRRIAQELEINYLEFNWNLNDHNARLAEAL